MSLGFSVVAFGFHLIVLFSVSGFVFLRLVFIFWFLLLVFIFCFLFGVFCLPRGVWECPKSLRIELNFS